MAVMQGNASALSKASQQAPGKIQSTGKLLLGSVLHVYWNETTGFYIYKVNKYICKNQ